MDLTDLQYSERIVLLIEASEFTPEDTEQMLLFTVKETNRNRNYPIYISEYDSIQAF